jgi:hypothetical protein
MEKEYKCDTCNKKFTNQNNLNTHINSAKYCIRQREGNNSKEYKCEYCENVYTQNGYLQAHISKCLIKKEFEYKENIDTIKKEHEEQIEYMRNKQIKILLDMDKEYDQKFIKKNNEIKLLKQKIQELENILQSTIIEKERDKGRIIELEKPKPVIKKCTINIKLSNIPIDNIPILTVDYVEANLHLYTFKEYKRGMQGLLDFLKQLMILGDNMNYACTDTSRNKFHKLTETKEWIKDGKVEFIHIILNKLEPRVSEFQFKLYQEQFEGDIDSNKKQIKKLEPFYHMFVYRGELRDKPLEKLIKKLGIIVGV